MTVMLMIFALDIQNVCFFAVSDDIIKAKKLLQSPTNEKYKVSFPGDGEATKPGFVNYFSYEFKILNNYVIFISYRYQI